MNDGLRVNDPAGCAERPKPRVFRRESQLPGAGTGHMPSVSSMLATLQSHASHVADEWKDKWAGLVEQQRTPLGEHKQTTRSPPSPTARLPPSPDSWRAQECARWNEIASSRARPASQSLSSNVPSPTRWRCEEANRWAEQQRQQRTERANHELADDSAMDAAARRLRRSLIAAGVRRNDYVGEGGDGAESNYVPRQPPEGEGHDDTYYDDDDEANGQSEVGRAAAVLRECGTSELSANGSAAASGAAASMACGGMAASEAAAEAATEAAAEATARARAEARAAALEEALEQAKRHLATARGQVAELRASTTGANPAARIPMPSAVATARDAGHDPSSLGGTRGESSPALALRLMQSQGGAIDEALDETVFDEAALDKAAFDEGSLLSWQGVNWQEVPRVNMSCDAQRSQSGPPSKAPRADVVAAPTAASSGGAPHMVTLGALVAHGAVHSGGHLTVLTEAVKAYHRHHEEEEEHADSGAVALPARASHLRAPLTAPSAAVGAASRSSCAKAVAEVVAAWRRLPPGGAGTHSAAPYFYAVLGCGIDATADELRRAYRRLALRWHPDKHAHTPARLAEAHRRFQELTAAWSVLSDATLRAAYDEDCCYADWDSQQV